MFFKPLPLRPHTLSQPPLHEHTLSQPPLPEHTFSQPPLPNTLSHSTVPRTHAFLTATPRRTHADLTDTPPGTHFLTASFPEHTRRCERPLAEHTFLKTPLPEHTFSQHHFPNTNAANSESTLPTGHPRDTNNTTTRHQPAGHRRTHFFSHSHPSPNTRRSYGDPSRNTFFHSIIPRTHAPL